MTTDPLHRLKQLDRPHPTGDEFRRELRARLHDEFDVAGLPDSISAHGDGQSADDIEIIEVDFDAPSTRRPGDMSPARILAAAAVTIVVMLTGALLLAARDQAPNVATDNPDTTDQPNTLEADMVGYCRTNGPRLIALVEQRDSEPGGATDLAITVELEVVSQRLADLLEEHSPEEVGAARNINIQTLSLLGDVRELQTLDLDASGTLTDALAQHGRSLTPLPGTEECNPASLIG